MRRASVVGSCIVITAAGLLGCKREEPAAPPLIEPEPVEAAAIDTPVVEAPAVEASELQMPATPAPVPPPAADYTSAHDVMEDMGRAFQYLRRNMNGTDNDADLLQRVATMRALATTALTLTPKQVEKAAESDRAALAATYNDHLVSLPPLLDELETAIKSGDRAAARAALKKVHDAEHAGHDALGVDH